MKLLIIGKTGQLGSALIEDSIRQDYEVIAPSRQEFDISDTDKFLELLLKHKPDAAINTAAFLDVYQCEIEPEKAFKYNCIIPTKMSKICNDLNIKFITFSTDYVFSGLLPDGRLKKLPYCEDYEDAAPFPLQIYGLSKLAGEYGILSYNKNSIIVRTCGLYGKRDEDESKGGKGNFVDNRIKDGKTQKRIEISNDQTVSPTYAGDLSKAVLELIRYPDSRGIYHLVNEGFCTWFSFTKSIFNIMNIDCAVIPIDRGGNFGDVRKPQFSVLNNKKASEKYNIILPHWKDALWRYLKLKYKC